ncbi:hypothetical protein, partial [Methylobacterium sp. WL30]
MLSLNLSLGYELVGEVDVIGYELAHDLLCQAHSSGQRSDMQPVIAEFDNHGITRIDAKLAPKRSWNDQLTSIDNFNRLRRYEDLSNG